MARHCSAVLIPCPPWALLFSLMVCQQPEAEVVFPKCCLNKSSTTQTQSREKRCCLLAGTLRGLPALGREGQELLLGVDWPLAQSVSEGGSGLGVLLTQFLGA